MHMMSIHTGLPGDTWFPDKQFNSTIDFDILMPTHISTQNTSTPQPIITTTCHASFLNGTLPLGRSYCSTPASATDVMFFELSSYTDLGTRRAELSFWLEVTSMVGSKEGNTTTTADAAYKGRKAITANDPSESSSFLTCLEGGPFDGLRCVIGSYLSVREDLVLDAEVVQEEEGGEVRM
jgi:hypothetical protein